MMYYDLGTAIMLTLINGGLFISCIVILCYNVSCYIKTYKDEQLGDDVKILFRASAIIWCCISGAGVAITSKYLYNCILSINYVFFNT